MATVIVVPDGDGTTNDWSQPASGTHFDDIDEHPGGPGIDNIGAFQNAGDDNDEDQFSMEDPSFEGDVSSQVVIWTYGWIVGSNQPEVTIIIGGETHGPVNVGLTGVQGWHSNTFTPDAEDWTELEATSLKVIYTADVPTSKDSNTINTCYALFTYPDPPAGWGHTFLGVPAANIAKINGIPIANIGKIKGVPI